MTPQRPALLPAIVFLSAYAWTFAGFSIPALLVVGIVSPIVLARCCRRFDLAFLVLAAIAGTWSAWEAVERPIRARGDAALAVPIAVPFEASWNATLLASPKPVEGSTWQLRVSALPHETVPSPARPTALVLEVSVGSQADRVRLAGLRAGDRVRLWARVHLGPPARGSIKSVALIETLERGPIRFSERLQRVRDRLYRRLETLYGSETTLTRFLAAVLLGERSGRSPALEERLRACGLSHLIAISGLHVGIVGVFLTGLGGRTLRSRWWRMLAVGAALCAFGVLVGGATPVQRAVGAATVLLIGCAIGREGDPLNRLAGLAIVIGVLSPEAPATIAYALSFSATAGILVAMRAREGTRYGVPWIGPPLRISISAYLATAPLSALSFGQLAPWAPLANLLAFPFLFVMLIAGYVSLLLGGIPYVGALTVSLTRFGFSGIERIAETLDRLPLSPLFVTQPHPLFCGFAVAAAGLGWLAPSAPLRSAARWVFALALVAMHLGPPPGDFDPPGAVLLDVGQGQALLWHNEGVTSLIDASGRGYGRWDPGARIVRPALLDRGVRRLHRLVLSHGHADHADGAFALIEAFPVEELWLGPGWWHDGRLSDIAAHARRNGAAIRVVWKGHAGGDVRVLGPPRRSLTSDNASSLILSLGSRPWNILVPGDLDGAPLDRFLSETRLEEHGALILAHHGSRRGTPDELLDAVLPREALASCGWKNRFGHPHASVVERLERRGIELWRTDHHGWMKLSAGNNGWRVLTERRFNPGSVPASR